MTPLIIGIVLVRNEDIYIERVLTNILEFCDEIIVTDNQSNDNTYPIICKLAAKHKKIKACQISHPRQSHEIIAHYAGTDSWIFAVDGDEIYDPAGLQKMKTLLKNGTFKNIWSITGNVLNCTAIDTQKQSATGYLAPPCRSMTKLVNFSLITSWTGCPQRLHSGTRVFRNDIQTPGKLKLLKTLDWDQSYFRCLHAVFVPRSSRHNAFMAKSRINPSEIEAIRSAFHKKSYVNLIKRSAKSLFGINWKQKKYRKGALTEKEISSFFP